MMPDRILIVDDEPVNLAILRQILEPDYRLIFACGGVDALTLAIKHHPALILLDIQMPELDGYAVCRALKADPQTETIPVIFVTTLSDLGNEEIGFAAGCVDYLTKPVSADIVRARVRNHLSLVQAKALEASWRDAVVMLARAGHYNDGDTGIHIWRMAAFARQLAEVLGWSRARCDLLELAATMHDTGKIGIPGTILRKPSSLDDQQWAVVKTHSRIGFEILSSSAAPVFQLAAEIALCHHEQWDGSGYPQGLCGEAIPESARIVAVADVFDALTMTRPYKNAWPLERVVTTLRAGVGTHFDPSVIAAFATCLPQLLDIKAAWDQRETLGRDGYRIAITQHLQRIAVTQDLKTAGPILVVDDDRLTQAILGNILERDYRLLFARSGAEALALAISDQPALILLDIQLPDLDGYAVCRALKTNPQTEAIPVIFVTALSDLGHEACGFATGGVDYLAKPVAAGIVRARVRTHLSLVHTKELEKSRRDAIDMIAKAVHYHAPDTGTQLWRMAACARQLAEAMGWSKARCDLLELAAPLHDTGMIGIPDVMRREPGKLESKEVTAMKTHSMIGFEILSYSDAPLFELAAEIALYHHENWDGSGYLMGLAGEAIPQSARIVAIADAFSALIMQRPDQDAWPVEWALATLREGADKQFDPTLIVALETCLPRILEINASWDRRDALAR
jgi:putative two-component system response regulator